MDPAYFIHPLSDVQTAAIGQRTRIWQFCVVLREAVIGEDCNICSHCFVESQVRIGHRVTIKCGVQLWDGITLEDDVFVGSNATFTNDPFPRSRSRPKDFLPTLVRRGASIGANATILPGLTLGEHCFIGAGAVITADVPARAVVIGNPGKIIRYLE